MAVTKDGRKIVVENRRARHSYSVEETFEAGMVLQGSEVKALREGRGQIAEAYAVVREDGVYLLGMHISPYSGASTHVVVAPARERKLLLHKKQIEHLANETQAQGMTLIPLRVYFAHGLAKIELGLARGKKTYDRRHEIAEREAKRQMDRAQRRREKA